METKLVKRMRQAAFLQWALWCIPLGLLYWNGFRVLGNDPGTFRAITGGLMAFFAVIVILFAFYWFFRNSFYRTAVSLIAPEEKRSTEIALFRFLCERYGGRGGFLFLLVICSECMVVVSYLLAGVLKTLWIPEILLVIWLIAGIWCRRLIFCMALPKEKIHSPLKYKILLAVVIAFPVSGAVFLYGAGLLEEREMEVFRNEIRAAGGFPTMKELEDHFGGRKSSGEDIFIRVADELKKRPDKSVFPSEVQMAFASWAEEVPPALWDEAEASMAKERELISLIDCLTVDPEPALSWNWDVMMRDQIERLNMLRELARLECIRMRLAVRRGDTAEAVRRFHSMGALRRWASSQPGIVSVLVGIAIEQIRLNAFVNLLSEGIDFTGEELQLVITEMDRAEAELRQTPPRALSAESIIPELFRRWVAEGLFPVDDFRISILLTLTEKSFLLKPGIFWSSRLDGRVAAEMIAAYLKPAIPKKPVEVPAGAVSCFYAFPAFDRFMSRYPTIYAHFRSVKTIAALELYRKAHGDYPESLSGLVPEFLDRVPADPFGDGPMRYLRKELSVPAGEDREEVRHALIVYSVWENREDDGGSVIWRKGEKTLDAGFARLLQPLW